MKNKLEPIPQFLILNFLTMGFYQIYWSWKAWETVRRSQKISRYKFPSSIRAVFLFISGLLLFPYLRDLAAKQGYLVSALAVRLLAIALLLIGIFLNTDIDGGPRYFGSIAVVVLLQSCILIPILRIYNHYVEKTNGKYTPEEINWPLAAFLVVMFVIGLSAVSGSQS